MSPELLRDPQPPTRSSDCYAIGMVIYETISGREPFYNLADLVACTKILEGKRPHLKARFPENLRKMLDQCWMDQPNDRPRIDDVLCCLEESSDFEMPPFASDDETEDCSNSSDPTVSLPGDQNRTSDAATTPGSPAPRVGVNGGGFYQVTATQPYLLLPMYHRAGPAYDCWSNWSGWKTQSQIADANFQPGFKHPEIRTLPHTYLQHPHF